jgi:gamma-glutamyltranspeptidase / glutathione hydrolase
VRIHAGSSLWLTLAVFNWSSDPLAAQQTQKPPLHARHWLAVTGKPLGATAGALIFTKGGNAVDASCAMLAAVTTMWDVLSWGGETQALIYNPNTRRVIGLNGLGFAPAAANVETFKNGIINALAMIVLVMAVSFAMSWVT